MPKLLKLIFLVTCYLLLVTPVRAQEEFTVIYNTSYIVDKEGGADVEQDISLTNNFSKIYASSYVFKIEGKRPENIKVEIEGQETPVELKEAEGKYEILIPFPDALVGKGKVRIFSVRYHNSQIAVRNGKVWDISIPKLASPEAIDEYNLKVKVPKDLGTPAYISPKPRSRTEEQDFQVFSFQKDDLTKAGMVATFGNFQVFTFNLTYHLPNETNKEIETEIALIPDTAYQRAYYEILQPIPLNVRLDEDGNWLAKYRVKPQENKVVAARVSVQIFSQPQEYYHKVLPSQTGHYLLQTDTWQTNDAQIQSLAKTLKTPRAIYEFVVNKLEYDYSRIREDTKRLGAKVALENPSNAICTEYTDLFIALARAAGIPAREINGYAHTENPQLQPLSLVADVLHAWPEYWDNQKGIWQPVDPTWEDTTGGIDFYDKFDLSHITFAIHGKDTSSPLPAGAYKEMGSPQKDIIAQFGTLPAERREQIEVKITPKRKLLLPFTFDLPFVPSAYEIVIKNQGQTAVYNRPLSLKGGKLEQATTVEFLAPYSSATLLATSKSPFFPYGSGNELIATFGEFSESYSLRSEQIIISRIVLLLTLVLLAVAGVFTPRLYLRFKKFVASLVSGIQLGP